MRVYKTTKYIMLLASFLLCTPVHAQWNNMGYVQQPIMMSTQYQTNSFYNQQGMVNPYQPQVVVDPNLPPVMSQSVYNNLNGFKTPNRYELQSPTLLNAQNQATNDYGYGLEYYMSLGYGLGSFTGEGLSSNRRNSDPPVNNEANSLGDPNSINVGLGVMHNKRLRLEIGFTSLTGLSYGDTATAYDQLCGLPFPNSGQSITYDCTEILDVLNGGNISSSAIMLSAAYSFPDLFKDLIGGETGDWLSSKAVPYIGAGVGISHNSIENYTVYDPEGVANFPTDTGTEGYYDYGNLTYDGIITHFGATTINMAYAIEAGVTFNLSKKAQLDLYYKLSNYGAITTRDDIFSDYLEIFLMYPTDGVCTDDYNFYYNEESGWCEERDGGGIASYFEDDFAESGTIETTEIGAKFRMLF